MITFIRFCFIGLICSFSGFSFAQQRRPLYDSVARMLMLAYNTKDPMNMYGLTAPAYQDKMSAPAFSAGTDKFYNKAGKWNGLDFREETIDGLIYTARFERESQLLFLQLDERGRIARFNFKPIPFVKSTKNYVVRSDNLMVTPTDTIVDRFVRPYIQMGHTAGLCVAIIQGDKVNRYSYGELQKGGGRLPDAENSIFEIGSITKTFTSLLLARAVIEGRLRLNDPVNLYLPDSMPDLSYNHEAVSFQNLANHTSGLPRLPENIFIGPIDPRDPYSHYKEELLYKFLKTCQLSVTPGTQFSYSNLGAGLLGNLLARVEGQNYEQLIREKICQPLKMEHTGIRLNKRDTLNLAQGYNERGEPTGLWNLASLQGAGAIRSTLNDMIRYTQRQLDQGRTKLDKAIQFSHQTTFENKDAIMALGWRIARRGDTMYWHHSGGTGGYRSFAGFDKKRQLGVVILSNTSEDVTFIGQGLLEHQDY